MTNPKSLPDAVERVKLACAEKGLGRERRAIFMTEDVQALLSQLDKLETENERLRLDRVFPKIVSARVCYSQGWSDGYGSAIKGRNGPCLDQAWAANQIAQALDGEAAKESAEASNASLVGALRETLAFAREAVQAAGCAFHGWPDAERNAVTLLSTLSGEAAADNNHQALVDVYDAGLLNDFGGGNAEWWQDYIRAELGRAHDFYAAQIDPKYTALGSACERHGLAGYDENGEMWLQPPADVIVEQAAEAALKQAAARTSALAKAFADPANTHLSALDIIDRTRPLPYPIHLTNAPVRTVEGCDWPEGTALTFHDEPGAHDPCYVVMPGGAMLPLNHHAGEGVDIARAKFIVAACNAALSPSRSPVGGIECAAADNNREGVVEALWETTRNLERLLNGMGLEHDHGAEVALYKGKDALAALQDRLTADEEAADTAWQWLMDKHAGNGSAEHPEMCLITREELLACMASASMPISLSRSPAPVQGDVAGLEPGDLERIQFLRGESRTDEYRGLFDRILSALAAPPSHIADPGKMVAVTSGDVTPSPSKAADKIADGLEQAVAGEFTVRSYSMPRTPSKADVGALVEAFDLSGVRAVVAECAHDDKGRWLTCSGCHETEEGQDVGHYPFSRAFNSKVGGGCSECGGLGMVWDKTDYDKMVEWMIADEAADDSRKALVEACKPFAKLYTQIIRDHGPEWFAEDGQVMRAALACPVANSAIVWRHFRLVAEALASFRASHDGGL